MKLLQQVRAGSSTQGKKRRIPERSGNVPNGKGTADKRKSDAAPGDGEDAFAGLPKLTDVPPGEFPDLFRRKMKACEELFDFNSDSKQVEKELKRQTLLEMVEYVNNNRNCFSEGLMQDVFDMLKVNIFRALKRNDPDPLALSDPEGDEPCFEKAWPHLQLVYEFFLRFAVSTEVEGKFVKKFMDQAFIYNYLDLFQSEDPRERDYLKNILHRIYGRFMALRPLIRRGLQDLFLKVIYESESCCANGLGEMLEIVGSIVDGFATPLKDEHKTFLRVAMIPLHKVSSFSSFFPQLSFCMLQYVEKDPAFATEIIAAILRFWPTSITSKQGLYLNEIEEILELLQPLHFRPIRDALLRRLALCIESTHFQVAERTMMLWNNEHMVKLISDNSTVPIPVVVSALHRSSNRHWNSAVKTLSRHVLKLMEEGADPKMLKECSSAELLEKEQEKEEKQRLHRWQALRDLHHDLKQRPP